MAMAPPSDRVARVPTILVHGGDLLQETDDAERASRLAVDPSTLDAPRVALLT